MATRVWQGGTGAPATAQVNTVTPASPGIGNTFTIAVNGKTVSFVATAATVANVTAGLVTAAQASAEPEFTELTFEDAATFVRVTGPDAGTPFTQTSSATGGTATLVTATATAASSPNHWSVAANWSGGAVPIAGDTAIIDNSAVSILYGLDQYAVTLAALTVGPSFTGEIGLPERNDSGYEDYRETFLKIGATAQTIRTPSSRVKIDNAAIATTLNVLATGNPLDSLPVVLWRGTNALNVVNVSDGSFGAAVLPDTTATIATLRVGGGQGNPLVRLGPGVTLTDVEQIGGELYINGGFTTLNKDGGTTEIFGAGAITNLNIDKGEVFYLSSGAIANLKVGSGGVMDFTRHLADRTITNCTVEHGATIRDHGRTVTWTNPWTLNRCGLEDITLELGTHLLLQVSAL